MSLSKSSSSCCASSREKFQKLGLFYGRPERKCPHCFQSIARCVLVEETDAHLHLFCTACDSKFSQPNLKDGSMTIKKGNYCEKVKVESIDQIGVCDLIQWTVVVFGAKTTYFGIFTAVDRSSQTARIVRLALNNETPCVVQSDASEESLLQGKAVVYRFMPLDCCSKDATLDRAMRSIANKGKHFLNITGASGSFETFANWLKTGKTKELIRRVRGVIDRCPSCSATFHRSFRLSSEEHLQLYCTFCGDRYELENFKCQRSELKRSAPGDYRTESLSQIDQLGPADVVKRRLALEGSIGQSGRIFYHHYICMSVDRQSELIHAIELNQDENGNVKIESRTLRFEEVKNSKIFRFLPLDCRPGEETLGLASEYAEKIKTWLPEKYHLVTNNCQHFASFCKSGNKSSEDLRDAIGGGVGGFLSIMALTAGVIITALLRR